MDSLGYVRHRLFLVNAVVARGRFELPSTGLFPGNGPKPVIGRALGPLLVRYTTGLQSSPDFD